MKLITKLIVFLPLYLGCSAWGESIVGLKWKYGPLRVVRSVSQGTFVVQFSGIFARNNWKLYLADYEIPIADTGEFTVTAPVGVNRFKAVFSSHGPNGEREEEVVRVSLGNFFPETKAKKRGSWLERESRYLSMNVGFGPTYLSYRQTDLEPVSGANLASKLDFAYALDPGVWTLEATIFSSFFSISQSAQAGPGMYPWGADLRLGREFSFDEGSWAAYLFGGMYTLGTFGTVSVGYGGIYGPELFPACRFAFSNGSSIQVYGKYSLILNGFSFLSPSNSHLVGGASYFFKPFPTGILRGVPLGISFEASRLKLNVLRGEMVTENYTLSLNLMF